MIFSLLSPRSPFSLLVQNICLVCLFSMFACFMTPIISKKWRGELTFESKKIGVEIEQTGQTTWTNSLLTRTFGGYFG